MTSQQVHQLVSLAEQYGPQIAQQALSRVGCLVLSITYLALLEHMPGLES